jgi:hypothetical protein
MPTLEKIEKSHLSNYKYVATFCLCPNGEGDCKKPQKKEIHFGASGYKDYTLGASDGERQAYRARHRVNENWDNPLSAGALSRYILWGDSRSVQENIKAFKKKFNV